MQWGEGGRLYLTPGDGLLISLLEEFLSKSVSFINDISLCSARYLLPSQKGNYLFRPGNNISYCLGSRARRKARRRKRGKHWAEDSCPQTGVPQTSRHVLSPPCMVWMNLKLGLCASEWGEGTWNGCPTPLPEIVIWWASLSTSYMQGLC